ncbi:WD-40 repeat-containing protein, partial [Reticulomyxa filosa]
MEKLIISTQLKLVSFILIFQKAFLFFITCVFVTNQSEEEIKMITRHWIRILKITLGWIYDFDKLVSNYVTAAFIFDEFCSSSKLLKTLIGHISYVNSIDYSTFDGDQFICSGSSDSTVRVWDVDTRKQIRLFEEHTSLVYCVKFSRYHYHNYHQSVICSSSHDNTIRFWDFKDNQQLRILSGHTRG